MQEAAADAEAKTDKQVAVVLGKPLDSPSSGTPVLEMAYLNLGAMLRRRGEYRDAEMILERFLAVRPSRPADPFVRDATYHLAMIDRAQGELESCKTRLGEAINLRRARAKPLDQILGIWLIHYGDVARQLDQVESAQIAYEEALAILQPTRGGDHRTVRQLQTRLAELKSQ
jgi:tetratricopeptide (TPR) repeat protein